MEVVEAKIIESIQELHRKHNHNIEIFTSKHLRAYDSAIMSRLERLKVGWSDILRESGIDPKCHIGKFSYGKSLEEQQNTFRKLVHRISSLSGDDLLNDNTMNTDEKVDIPEDCWSDSFKGKFIECEYIGCKPIQLSRRSIYAKGRRLYGDWRTAIESSGIKYENVLRKPSSLEFEKIVKDLDKYDIETNSNWTITSIREKRHSLERAIYNLKKRKTGELPYGTISDNIVYVVWVNMMYWREHNEISENNTWYENASDSLAEIFNLRHRAQEQWDENSIILGIQGIYGRGANDLRLSREDVNIRGTNRDKTLWAAMRQKRFRDNGINETDWLNKSGILIDKLREKYRQIDEKYTVEECLQYFALRMKESLDTGENRLTREFNQVANADFTNFIINKYTSWEAGLKDHGLDPKFFSITSSKAAKRGYRFQKFIEEQFELSGLVKVKNDPKEGEFVPNRSIKDCSHNKKCKPDFRFKNFIIDTKTGYHASQKPEQLLRYFDHAQKVLILTLNDKEHTVTLDGRLIDVMGFNTFIAKSRELIGVKLEDELNAQLTSILKQHPFWN